MNWVKLFLHNPFLVVGSALMTMCLYVLFTIGWVAGFTCSVLSNGWYAGCEYVSIVAHNKDVGEED